MTFKQIFKKNKQVDWDLFVSRYSEVPTLFAYLNASSQWPPEWMFKVCGIRFGFQYQKRIGNIWYWSKRECDNLAKLLDKQANKDRFYLLKSISKNERHCKELYNWSIKMKRDYSSATNKELAKNFAILWNKLRAAGSFLLVKHVLNRVIERRIKEKLAVILEKRGRQARLDSYFEKILIPSRKTLISEAREKLASLNINNSKQIKNWLSKYNWIDTFYWSGPVLTEENMVKKIKSAKKDGTKYQNNKAFNKLKFELKLSGALLSEIMALQNLLFVHTLGLETLFASKYWYQGLLSEIAVRIGCSFDDYAYATYEEIINSLRGRRLDKKKIFRRKHNQFALFRFGDKINIFEGKNFKKIKQIKQPLSDKIKEIKGASVFFGKVIGTAKIIKTVSEFKKLKNSDILITPMTTVDFVPYLKNVSAIVTDEGGITCHAAIISRELKKPCIIGTKIATRVLHDGDLVEVDAAKGVVRILKRRSGKN